MKDLCIKNTNIDKLLHVLKNKILEDLHTKFIYFQVVFNVSLVKLFELVSHSSTSKHQTLEISVFSGESQCSVGRRPATHSVLPAVTQPAFIGHQHESLILCITAKLQQYLCV